MLKKKILDHILFKFGEIPANFHQNPFEKYTSASRKRVTHNGARHKGALRPRDKEGEQTIFRLRVAFNLLKIISLKSLPYFDSTYDVIRVI